MILLQEAKFTLYHLKEPAMVVVVGTHGATLLICIKHMAKAEFWSESMAGKMTSYVKAFLKRIEVLEVEKDGHGNGIDREFGVIDHFEMMNWRAGNFTSIIGESNMDKNVYSNIMPYDNNRLRLDKKKNDPRSDYINASFIQGVMGSAGYIAAQGPLESTVDDFWRMVWEQGVEIVFMACPTEGYGKCKRYWNSLGKSHRYGDITVHTKSEEVISSDFVKRMFNISLGKEQRTVIHHHFSGWPDHGVPKDVQHIQDVIAIMRQSRKSQRTTTPTLVHCKGGVGRTGTIISIDYVWTLLDEGKLDEKFSICDMLCTFRKQRMWIVENQDQYAFVYQVIKSLCKDWLSKVHAQGADSQTSSICL